MDNIRYEKQYRLPVYDIGPDGRLAPHALFNYLQDIASDHAVRLRFGKDDLMKENRFWVLSRITAEISYWPGWDESLTVRTWPRGTDGLFAIRDFKVTTSEGRIIASASSSWLVVDRTTRRVQRPDTLLSKYNFETPAESSLGKNAEKIPGIEGTEERSDPFAVKTSELDVNLHTNNVMYIKWAMDAFPMDFRMENLPARITVNYLAESRRDDQVVVITIKDKNNDSACNQSVLRNVDNTELCRIRTEWISCRE
jgi:acyl-ACP thioesterase